jgi:hypothetical protein
VSNLALSSINPNPIKLSVSEDKSLAIHNHKILKEAGEKKEALPEFTRDQVMFMYITSSLAPITINAPTFISFFIANLFILILQGFPE